LPHLPGTTVLLLPVRAHLLADARVQEALAVRPSLGRLIVEVAEGGRHRAGEPDEVARYAHALRARGAEMALATGGRCTASVPSPDLVVLDRDTTAVFAESGLASGVGPRLLADRIESADDLSDAQRCGAALGRGWLFGPPSSTPGPLAPPVAEVVRTRSARLRTTAAVLPLVRPVLRAPAEPTTAVPVVEVAADGTPAALLLAGTVAGGTWRRPVTATVLPTTSVADAVRLALGRPADHRYDPVLCTDEAGRPLGVLRVAELVRARGTSS
jgi:hypothetical protein